MNDKLIYALKCPLTDAVHYIGKSTNGLLRPFTHIRQSHSEKVREWVADLVKAGLQPKIVVLQQISEVEDIDIAERYWIEKYHNEGALLLNSILYNAAVTRPVTFDEIVNSERDDLKHIAETVKAFRKRVNLSQQQMADKLGMSIRTVRVIEQCGSYHIESLLNVLWLFGASIEIKRKSRDSAVGSAQDS